MRTTIEIPDELRERLIAEAARRGEKGYSSVVERALRRYFALQHTTETRHEIARRLRGSAARAADGQDREGSPARGRWRTGSST